MRAQRRYRHYREGRIRRLLPHILRPLLLAAAGFILTHGCFFRTYVVPDDALAPRLETGDILIVSLLNRNPMEKDIGLVYPPYTRPHTLASRLQAAGYQAASRFFDVETPPRYLHMPVLREVIAVEGASVAFSDFPGQPENFPPNGFPLTGQKHLNRIPEGHIAIAAHSTEGFLDSRHYGPVSRSSVRGSAVFRVWPWKRIGRP
ncbi:MAG: hypothetical protein ACOCVC_03015 [Spirochaeta sp.]